MNVLLASSLQPYQQLKASDYQSLINLVSEAKASGDTQMTLEEFKQAATESAASDLLSAADIQGITV